MPRFLQYVFSVLILTLLIGGPLAYSRYQRHEFHNFRVVDEGVLYRSGQMSLDGLKRVIAEHEIKTVITFRDTRVPGEPAPDFSEEDFCNAHGIHYFRIPTWYSSDQAAMDEGVRKFKEIMANPGNHPVLIHCFAGIHRTGTFCAIYRLEFDHWTIPEAVAEMKACGFSNIENEPKIVGYLKQSMSVPKE